MKDPFIKPSATKDPFVMPGVMKDPFVTPSLTKDPFIKRAQDLAAEADPQRGRDVRGHWSSDMRKRQW